ncbi:hypothetical protein Vretifemale_20168 [Volvox reticuliferus]|uniref:Galactose oxidase n=1 Tax=Volvox reticuliferus TaxID=1737510 RepID=A0A8J4D324_9CHLO|nr:hypothetical protein Vretifemale_20168 [Volvox reticuliferus]
MGGQWRLVKPEGLAPAPRGAHASVALGTKVLVFGGADRAPIPFNDLWALETADSKYEWTRISPLMAPGCKLLPRSGATLTVVGDRVYLFGGTEPVSGVCFNELKVLDPATWTWSDVEPQGTLPAPRHSHCSGCLAETCLIVYGGAGYQGPMQDLWIYNTLQNAWSRPTVSGDQPQAREMHTGCMVDTTTLLVYGGRGSNFKVCCDAALFDAQQMKWTAIEPTPFSRCAHSSVVLPPAHATSSPGKTGSGDTEHVAHELCQNGGAVSEEGNGTAATVQGTTAPTPGTVGSSSRVLIYGGYSGEAVEGDLIQIDSRTLEIELVRRGPRESDKGGTVPSVRFAHSAVIVPSGGSGGSSDVSHTMVVFGGVNPKEDLNDVAVWVLG